MRELTEHTDFNNVPEACYPLTEEDAYMGYTYITPQEKDKIVKALLAKKRTTPIPDHIIAKASAVKPKKKVSSMPTPAVNVSETKMDKRAAAAVTTGIVLGVPTFVFFFFTEALVRWGALFVGGGAIAAIILVVIWLGIYRLFTETDAQRSERLKKYSNRSSYSGY